MNKNGAYVTLKLSSNVVGDFNDETNFPHKLLLSNTQVFRLRKASTKDSSTNDSCMKLSKTRLHKIGQWQGFLGRVLGALLKTRLPLIGNVLKLVAKSVIIPLGLPGAVVAAAERDATCLDQV